ncbi:4-hydroxy-tetrahydrodipicolinate synthase [hydrothermal vent metagenome]|uniref:4-hydroxy-tetrahydrodipicolinate synthase n=1 Tax=hydrothermal vent metagenome TaxID=652676 RepID=A0A3B0R4L1_9ZZZZ
MFRGCFTALVTPFKGGKVDEDAFRGLIEFQIENGVDGIVPCGTTGESATLTHDEHNRVVDIAVEAAGGRVKVIAGAGSNSTGETVRLTRHAKEAGADAALLITPYYNKPTQAGLYEHYSKVAAEVDIPIILYNVPGRTGVNMTPETTGKLSAIDNIVGIKDATGDIAQVTEVIERSVEGFEIISGDDFITMPMLAIGAEGVISVTSNIMPREVSDMCRLFFEGNLEASRELHYRLQGMHRAMFIETSPIPAKTALSIMGLMEEEFRLPLLALSDSNRVELEKTLTTYGLAGAR